MDDGRQHFSCTGMTVIRFERPPVTEVVFAVSFTLSQPLKTAHLGSFWELIRGQFPRIEDNPPLSGYLPVSSDGVPVQQVELMFMPPLRRVWFLDEDGRYVIQVQEDRFIFNWKRIQGDLEEPSYPGFDEMNRRFEQHLATFLGFLGRERMDAPSYTFLELIYVNHIDAENGLGDMTLSEVLVDHRRDASRERFLPEPIALNWASQYALPDERGSLQVQAQTVSQAGTGPAMRVDIAARGIPATPDEHGRSEWFQMAHDWATHGFTDSLAAALQKEKWGRDA